MDLVHRTRSSYRIWWKAMGEWTIYIYIYVSKSSASRMLVWNIIETQCQYETDDCIVCILESANAGHRWRTHYCSFKHILYRLEMTASRWMQTNFSAKCKQCGESHTVLMSFERLVFALPSLSKWNCCCSWPTVAGHRVVHSTANVAMAYRIFTHQWICNQQSNTFDI